MLGNMSKKKDQEEKRSPLNNMESDNTLAINRGVELLLRKNKRREEEPKTFQMKFGKLVSLFRREFHFYLELHLDVRKKPWRK
jgi:hypothetical protein